jgi:hypothetical protein
MKTEYIMKPITMHQTLADPLQWEMYVTFAKRDVRSLYMPGSLTTEAKELAKYTVQLMGVQEVR